MSSVVTRPRPLRGALSARVVSTAAAPDGEGVVNQSVMEGGKREGVAEQCRGRWRLVCGVQSGTGRPKLFDRHKIGYVDSNAALTNKDFRAGSKQSRVGHS